MTLLLLIAFVIAMFLVVRPALKWLIRRPGAALSNQVPLALVLAVAAAWVTTTLGMQPIFGAFLAGLIMPGKEDAPDTDVLR